MKHLIALFLLAALSYQVQAGVIGASPGTVDISGVLKDGYAEQQITVTSSDDEMSRGIIRVKGDIKPWITFEKNLTEFNLSRDKPHTMMIIARPPADTQTGNYSGTITIYSSTIEQGTGRAGGTVLPGVMIPAAVEVVGDQRISCSAGGFTVYDAEAGFPIELKATVRNGGNVRISPNGSLEVWDAYQENIVATYRFRFQELLPTASRQLIQQIEHSLEPGQYWGVIKLPQCNSESLETFDILEKGMLADRGTFLELRHKNWAVENETILIVAVFRNEGDRGASAKFEGHILNEGRIVQKLNSDEIDVQPGETVNLITFFEPPAPSIYTVSGRVKYNKKVTFEKQGVINVTPGIRKARSTLPIFIIYIALIVSIIFLLRLIIRKRRENEGND